MKADEVSHGADKNAEKYIIGPQVQSSIYYKQWYSQAVNSLLRLETILRFRAKHSSAYSYYCTTILYPF